MALVFCPDCGKQVSEHAEVCPNCGYPVKSNIDPFIKENTVNNVSENYGQPKNKGDRGSKKAIIVICLLSIISILGVTTGIVSTIKVGGLSEKVEELEHDKQHLSSINEELQTSLAKISDDYSVLKKKYNEATKNTFSSVQKK